MKEKGEGRREKGGRKEEVGATGRSPYSVVAARQGHSAAVP